MNLRKIIKEEYKNRIPSDPINSITMGPLIHLSGEVSLYDHFNVESGYWKKYRKLRESVLSKRKNMFNPKSLEAEDFHKIYQYHFQNRKQPIDV